MNERINQLLGQAYDEAVPETWTTLSSEQLGRVYDKFAELIVQEMLRLLEQYTRDSFPEDDIDEFFRGYLAGLHTVRWAVEKHFGVEDV